MKSSLGLFLLIITVAANGTTTQNSNQQKAERMAQEAFGDLLAHCSGEIYGIESRAEEVVFVWQFRGVDIGAVSGNLTEADAMNNVEYRGGIYFKAKFIRRFLVKDRVWRDWMPELGNPEWSNESLLIEKRNGEWKYRGSKMATSRFLMKPSCADVDRALSGDGSLRDPPSALVEGGVFRYRGDPSRAWTFTGGKLFKANPKDFKLFYEMPSNVTPDMFAPDDKPTTGLDPGIRALLVENGAYSNPGTKKVYVYQNGKFRLVTDGRKFPLLRLMPPNVPADMIGPPLETKNPE